MDWFAKHRFFTRLLTLSLAVSYVYSVTRAKSNAEIVSTTGWLVLFALIILTFGLNAIEKVTDLVKAWKGKK